jgi:hypothetical protein
MTSVATPGAAEAMLVREDEDPLRQMTAGILKVFKAGQHSIRFTW